MNQEPASGHKSARTAVASCSSGSEGAAASCSRDATISTSIDFHTPAFNLKDGLDDLSANYRTFQPLGDIVTADIRHQMERQIANAADDACMEDEASGEKMLPEDTMAAATEAVPLAVVSQGRILIVDTDSERAVACGKRLRERGMSCTLLVVRDEIVEASFFPRSPHAPMEVNALSVTGAFGGFAATVAVRKTQKPLTESLGIEAATFDLILDLQPSPSYAGECLPLGYYAPGPSPTNLDEVIAELSEMKGQFTKPQFTIFRKEKCLHGRSRTRGCRLCLDICPVAAIQTDNKTISVNHYLCQGCGGCALVCPADAIRMAHPSRGEFLSELLSRVEEGSTDTSCPPALVISDEEYADPARLSGLTDGGDDRWISFPAGQIGYAGLEVVLPALASGAGRVIVAYGAHCPPKIAEAMAWQARMTATILAGLGIEPDRIRFVEIPPDSIDRDKVPFLLAGFDGGPDIGPMPKTAFSDRHDKSALVRLATQHLYEQSGRHTSWFPLPARSPFGAVSVDTSCTLCMACAVACPTGALSAGGDWPRLSFRESSCHQCGLCEETCPEGAIHLLPRMLCDQKTADTPTVVKEAASFRCVECGVPFASQGMIDRIQDKLAGHWMYVDDRQLRRLRMCGICRAQDALSSQDMRSWNQR